MEGFRFVSSHRTAAIAYYHASLFRSCFTITSAAYGRFLEKGKEKGKQRVLIPSHGRSCVTTTLYYYAVALLLLVPPTVVSYRGKQRLFVTLVDPSTGPRLLRKPNGKSA